MLLRDAAGVTFNTDEALRRLRQSPTLRSTAIFVHQLGHGDRGWPPLLDGERLGKEAADVAIRILRGEPLPAFPPKSSS